MKKAQLTPIYLVILVILVIVFFAIINVGKVSLIKTHSANSADAGALAAASVMANALNSTAVANNDLYHRYREFEQIILGGTSSSTSGPMMAEIPAYLGSCACEAAAASIREMAGLIAALEYATILYGIRQLKGACLTAKILQDAWIRAFNLALELSVMNAGLFPNISAEGRKAYVDWFNSRTWEQDYRLSWEYPRELLNLCKYVFKTGFKDAQKGDHNIEIEISVDKRKLWAVQSQHDWYRLFKAVQGTGGFFYLISEDIRKQMTLAQYACVGCRILDCPPTCSVQIASSAATLNSDIRAKLDYIRGMLIARTRIVDRDISLQMVPCHSLSGRCRDIDQMSANYDPGPYIRAYMSLGFMDHVISNARAGVRPGVSPPGVGDYYSLRNFLFYPLNLANSYPMDTPFEFYFQQDAGELERNVIVTTKYDHTPVEYTFWESTIPTLMSYSEASYNYRGFGSIKPPYPKDFTVGIVRTDQLEIPKDDEYEQTKKKKKTNP